MRRTIETILVTALLVTVAIPANASNDRPEGWRDQQCRFARQDGHKGWTDREILAGIACATDKWSVPGGYSGAVCIAQHESGLNEHARNPSTSAGGLYQWLESSWPIRSYPELVRRWGLSSSRFNARSAFTISVRVAQNGGWSPTWSVASTCGLS